MAALLHASRGWGRAGTHRGPRKACQTPVQAVWKAFVRGTDSTPTRVNRSSRNFSGYRVALLAVTVKTKERFRRPLRCGCAAGCTGRCVPCVAHAAPKLRSENSNLVKHGSSWTAPTISGPRPCRRAACNGLESCAWLPCALHGPRCAGSRAAWSTAVLWRPAACADSVGFRILKSA